MKKIDLKIFKPNQLPKNESVLIVGGEGGKPPKSLPGDGSGPVREYCGTNGAGEYSCFNTKIELELWMASYS